MLVTARLSAANRSQINPPIKEHNGSFSKGDKVLCLLYLWVLPHSKQRGGVRRFSFENVSLYAPDSPSPHACTHLSPKWSTMVFQLDRRQDPKDMQKAIPSLYPSWLFAWAIRVLPHKDNHDLCLVSFLKMMKIVLSSQIL
jgi:hypothetical protein